MMVLIERAHTRVEGGDLIVNVDGIGWPEYNAHGHGLVGFGAQGGGGYAKGCVMVTRGDVRRGYVIGDL